MRSVLCLSFLFLVLVFSCLFSSERPTSAKLDRPPDRIDVPPPCAPPPNNLVSWWRGEGNAFDMRGGNNGALENGTSFVTGDVGQAFSINGTNQDVLIGNPSNLQLQDFTIDGWIQRTSATLISGNETGGPGGIIFGYGNGGYEFGLLDDGTLFLSQTDISNTTSTGAMVTDTNFHHLAVTKSGATVTFFVDGVAAAASSSYNPTFTFSSTAYIGQSGDQTNNFYGNLDEIEIFSRALTTTEIQSIFNAGSSGKCVTCTLAPRGLVSWWPGDGNAFDVRSSNNGTLQGGATFASGEVGQGFSFDGVNAYVEAPSTGFPTGNSDRTMELWFEMTSSVASEAFLAGYGSFGSFGQTYHLGIGAGNTIFFSDWADGFSGPAIQLGTWYHVAVTNTGNSETLYLNGQPVASGRVILNTANAPFFYMGRIPGSLGDIRKLNGLVDEVGVYNRALSQPEIQAIYQAGRAGKCKPTCLVAPPNLVGWWGGDGDATDISGNSNNGTLQAGAGFAIGKVGQSFSLNGASNQYVDVGNVALPPTFTIDAWIHPTALANQMVFSKVGNGIPSYLLFMLSNGALQGQTLGVSGLTTYNTSSGAIVAGAWNHVAMTYDGSAGANQKIHLYVNGVSLSTTVQGIEDFGGTPRIIAATAKIGTEGDPGAVTNSFTGLIDEVQVFNRVLSATEIQQIYNAGLAGDCKSVTSSNPLHVGDATITFNGVAGGDAAVVPIDPNWSGTLPANHVNTGLAYDIQTSTSASSYDICFNLPAITSTSVFQQLRVLHGESGILLDRTSSSTSATHTLCAHVTSLSPFGIAQNTSAPTAAGASISGLVTTGDGEPLAGVVMRLSGTASETTVTDSAGHYAFDNVDANQFYTVTPQLANFTFSPANRSFSLLGDKADAIFTGTPNPIAMANPLDTSEYFVRQQYLDFLGREPDQEGLDYWSGQLNQCHGDAACLSAQRIAESAAFFRSVEFQQSGSFVYRIYKAGLGRQLSYAEFTSDHAKVLGGPDLEANQAAFINGFVQRAEFISKYAAATTAEAFVDALLQNIADTGVDFSKDRDTLIALYLGAQASLPASSSTLAQARGAVLQAVAKDADYQSATFNQAFVLMEYFGYLRRDPDPGGYQFWLNALNNAPGNYRGMVCSFVTSAEYQRRFSSVITHSNSECGE